MTPGACRSFVSASGEVRPPPSLVRECQRPSHRGFALIAVVALFIAAACGSTVPSTERSARTGSAAADEFSEGMDTNSTGSDTSDGVIPSGADGAEVNTTPSAAAGAREARSAAEAARSPDVVPDGSPAAAPPDGQKRIPVGKGVHGVTDTTIEVGIWYWEAGSGAAVVGGLTGSSVNTGIFPDRREIQKLVDYINSNGGVAGRELKVAYLEMDATHAAQRSTRDRMAQSMCAAWTEDRQVFAFMTLYGGPLLECALRTKTVILNEAYGRAVMSESMLAKGYHDIWYSTDVMVAERRGRSLVEVLWNQGYFGEAAKVGILTHDDEAAKDGTAKGLIPALAQRGITDKDVTEIVYPDGIESPWQNYILQFQTAGVTHILMSPDELSSYPAFFTMKAAEDQRYYPKWGFATDQGLRFLTTLGAPRTQLANTQGMGWLPIPDGVQDAGGGPQTSTGEKCNGISEKVRPYCEVLFFLQLTLSRASEVSPAGMSAAMRQVATDYTSIFTIDGATSFSPQDHNGPTVYRDFAFDADRCAKGGSSCFKYTSPPKALPS